MKHLSAIAACITVLTAACASEQPALRKDTAAEDAYETFRYLDVDLFRSKPFNKALESCCGLPPRADDGGLECRWYRALSREKQHSVLALVEQLLDGTAAFPADPKLAYDWYNALSDTGLRNADYAQAQILLDSKRRAKIAKDPAYYEILLPQYNPDSELRCLGVMAMVDAAAKGQEAALRWVYENELKHAREGLYPLDDDMWSPDERDRNNARFVFSPDLLTSSSLEALEAIIYTMYLEGYAVPQEARARLEAMVRGDYMIEVFPGTFVDQPTRFLASISTVYERYCP